MLGRRCHFVLSFVFHRSCYVYSASVAEMYASSSSASSTGTSAAAVASTLVVIVRTGVSVVGPPHKGTRSGIVSSLVFRGRLGSLFISGVLTVVLRSFFSKFYSSFRLLFEKMRHRWVSLDLIEVITIREIHPLVRGWRGTREGRMSSISARPAVKVPVVG